MMRVASKENILIAAVGLVIVAGLIGGIANSSKGRAVQGSDPQQFAMPDLSGKEWRLTDYRGKVVLLNFWATWCPPCRRETPGLIKVSNEFRDRGLVVAGVAMDEEGAEPVRPFVKDYGIPYAILIPPRDSPLFGAISSLPLTMVFDRGGRVVRRYDGAVSEAQLRKDLDRIVSEP